MGASFFRAAKALGLKAHICDSGEAYDAPWLLRAVNWHLLGRRPPYLRSFSRQVVEVCKHKRPTYLLTTGVAPIRRSALESIGELGVRRLNFLTDDPWNPVHNASWFFDALPAYNIVLTPRRANESQLRELCPSVEYLPFGYDDDLFYPEEIDPETRERLSCEVLFVGGADDDRVPFIRALKKAGIDVATYGGYWDDYLDVSDCWRGHASPDTIRKATRAADISLCLVRRANRDGHVMRSLEIPAIGGTCMLAEDTDEHREVLGSSGETACYFQFPSDMVEQAETLLNHPGERDKRASAVHEQIARGEHTYRDRLKEIVELAR